MTQTAHTPLLSTTSAIQAGSAAALDGIESAALDRNAHASTQQAPPLLPRRDFVATLVGLWNSALVACSRLWDGYALECPVLDSTPLKDADWSTLFAYMHRRFGPPNVGGDDYKDLSAGWMLHTPDPEVFLQVSPSLAGAGFSFTPRIATSRDRKVRFAEELSLSQDRIAEIKDAYRATLLDLLRPVCVRDSNINALGEVDDDSDLLVADEETEEAVYEVRYHASSGFAMPAGLFGGEEWVQLCGLISELGAGDMVAGRRTAIDRLQQPAVADTSHAPWRVQRLVLLGATDPAILAAKLDPSGEAIRRFEVERVALTGAKLPAFVDEMCEESVRDAAKLLCRLGYQGHGIARTVRQLRSRRACELGWDELVSIASDDFPEASLPSSPWTLGIELPAAFKARLQELGREDLAAWVDRLVARTEGLRALEQIVCHLHSQRRNQAVQRDMQPPADTGGTGDNGAVRQGLISSHEGT